MTVDAEFSLLPDNAAEAGLPWRGDPVVRRVCVDLAGGLTVSALAWGDDPAQVVLLHGGGQNAHTFDTLALALDRPVLALDLPGHGHSSWRPDHDYSPAALAEDISAALDVLAPGAQSVVGMSLGGLAALCLAAAHPDQVARLALIDITPGTNAAKAEPILAFMAGPERFASFDEMLDRTVAFNPTRSVSSLRRGVIHNARELPDGSWTWRWDPEGRTRGATGFESLWPAVESVHVPLLLVRGARSSVVSDDDVAELRHRQPGAQMELVADAGHSVQGDQPLALARILDHFLS
ncbi:MAG TPA: alpha/beta hydrolase [Acidimicrobiales bacterium]|nr:alpha/beta hydrolase [Acidimicrobiales bacterium]